MSIADITNAMRDLRKALLNENMILRSISLSGVDAQKLSAMYDQENDARYRTVVDKYVALGVEAPAPWHTKGRPIATVFGVKVNRED